MADTNNNPEPKRYPTVVINQVAADDLREERDERRRLKEEERERERTKFKW